LQDLQRAATSGMLSGTASHEELEKTCVPMKVRQAIRAIKGTEPVGFREFPLVAKHEDYTIAGILDKIMFATGRPILLADDKFPTNERNFESPPFPNQEAQLLLYGFLLERTGFDVRDLSIRLVKHYDGKEKEFVVSYNREKVEDILTSCGTVQKLYYSVLSNGDNAS
jgi:hypothetical protein